MVIKFVKNLVRENRVFCVKRSVIEIIDYLCVVVVEI